MAKAKTVKQLDANRIKTGIPGLDENMGGGLVPASVNLISGGTGSGKSIFCMQFLWAGAKDYGEKGLYISLEETETNLKADVKGLGIDFAGMDEMVKFIYIPPFDVRDFISILHRYLLDFKPKRVVIDSLSALEMHMEDDFERKKEIYKINELLKSFECTSFLSSEIPSENAMSSETVARFSKYGIEEFLCDCVVALYYAGLGGDSDRAIRVIKQRRSSHTRAPLPMSIDVGGMRVEASKY